MRYFLLVCTHNAGRPQMARAFFERHAPDGIRAESAGEDPAREIWPGVVEAVAEVGIDIAKRRPKKLLTEMQLHARLGRDARLRRAMPLRSRQRSRTGTFPIPPACRSNGCDRSAMRSSAGCATLRRTGSRRSEATAARTTPASRACSGACLRLSSASLGGADCACAHAILDDDNEVPIRSTIMTLATRQARERLRAERRDVLAPV